VLPAPRAPAEHFASIRHADLIFLDCRERPEKDAGELEEPRSEKVMTRKTATFVLGSALALVAFSIAPANRQASAQEDCRVYREGSSQRAACDARLAKWMIQQNKRISREGASGGCGDRCEELIRQRNNAARKFEANDD
jgi:hypothetical protein